MRTALLFVLGAGFAGFGALEVVALNPTTNASALFQDRVAVVEDEQGGTDVETAPQACLTAELAARLGPRDAELRDKEAMLDLRQAELDDLENALDTRLSELETRHSEIKAMSTTMSETAEEDISHLVEMYSTMKPKKAAEIFDRMDPAFAAGFLREMESARAGTIMADMGTEQSYRVSLLIANRHAAWRQDTTQ